MTGDPRNGMGHDRLSWVPRLLVHVDRGAPAWQQVNEGPRVARFRRPRLLVAAGDHRAERVRIDGKHHEHVHDGEEHQQPGGDEVDRKSTRLNSSHGYISYAVFCLKKK